MVGGVLVLGMRLFYVAVGLVGLSMASSAYPPSGSEPPYLLLVGVGLVCIGALGAVRPDLVRSGSGSGE